MAAEGTLRLDKWLWHARFVKSRSLAAQLAEKRLRLNGTVVSKAHQPVRPGDVLTFSLSNRVRVIRVLALSVRRGPPAEARLLYEDLSPAPPPRETHVPGGEEDDDGDGEGDGKRA
jgi:ribosome-associated heat shock protein Hsp15